ncbi:hypothetical protein [Streptomyces sp. GF20]|uniref:hypothetical protein n=1 Tax=Streptomyces sp. GF20 TaxID=2692235 RepID=UPI002E294FB9|nr:hypothetical protein [Streptomyces sp. GF20]
MTQMGDVVRIGSRASKLARAQVGEWLASLADRFPHVTFKREIILEGGDQDRAPPRSPRSPGRPVGPPSPPTRKPLWPGVRWT